MKYASLATMPLVWLMSCSTQTIHPSQPVSLEARMNECLLENGYSETDVKNLNRGVSLHSNPYWHKISSDQKATYSKCKTLVTKNGRKYTEDTGVTHSHNTNRTTGLQITPRGIQGVLGESTQETKSVRKSFQIQSEP